MKEKRRKKRIKALIESIDVLIPEYVCAACAGDWDKRDEYREQLSRITAELWTLVQTTY